MCPFTVVTPLPSKRPHLTGTFCDGCFEDCTFHYYVHGHNFCVIFASWSVFILYSQIIVNMLMLTFDRHLYSGLLYATDGNAFTAFVVKVVLAFYGIWNLDFIPNIIPPFCLHNPKWVNLLLSMLLQPLLIIAAMYLCVHLHSRDVKLIVLPWRSIKYCLNFKLCCGMKRIVQRVTSQSIANSFSSVLILTFSKILFVSPYLIIPVQMYDLNGTTIATALFYGLTYFDSNYIPYVMFALCCSHCSLLF